MNFVEELRWRKMLQNITPGTEKRLNESAATGYAGFDPTASSLQIGNLAAIMLLVHFQRAGHKPIALVGGATGMIGDPSGKSEERNLMSIEEIQHNLNCFKIQLEKFLDFDCGENSAEIVNNYDWFGKIKFLDFLRDVGKHLTVNYMMAKDSVQNRLETGLSFTEFSYQLLQGYDYYWLNQNKNCVLQIGGSDQWGNITSGTELIRRMSGNDVYALTCPLVTRADGTKFGKSTGGQKIWLDPAMTSPYRFYQFWVNCSDEEVSKYLRVFTLKTKDQIESLESMHADAPHSRIMQSALAKDVTIRVHSKAAYDMAVEASQILFGKGTTETLHKLTEKSFLDIFDGVPQKKVARSLFDSGINIISLLAEETDILSSKGEARRMIKNNAISINKNKITKDDTTINSSALLNERFILVQKGKKNYVLIDIKPE